jgi:hypothetical protein
MAKAKDKNPISPERAAEIASDAQSGTNWAALYAGEPACACGLSDRYITGNRGYTKHGIPTGRCERHDGKPLGNPDDARRESGS